ncbi:hypothetical protein [Ideonella sp.]|uniref:hypothetical protein n=1 Tax=Ideonella sp. TaxID=1929293 RepID=UPI0035AECF54
MNHPAPWSPAFVQAGMLFTQRWLQHLARWIGECVEPPRALRRAPAQIPVRPRDARSQPRPSRQR